MKELRKELIAALTNKEQSRFDAVAAKIQAARDALSKSREQKENQAEAAVPTAVDYFSMLDDSINEVGHPYHEKSPLTIAMEIWPEVIPQLMKLGALWDLDKKTGTALICAINRGNIDEIKSLLRIATLSFQFYPMRSAVESAAQSKQADDKTVEILEALWQVKQLPPTSNEHKKDGVTEKSAFVSAIDNYNFTPTENYTFGLALAIKNNKPLSASWLNKKIKKPFLMWYTPTQHHPIMKTVTHQVTPAAYLLSSDVTLSDDQRTEFLQALYPAEDPSNPVKLSAGEDICVCQNCKRGDFCPTAKPQTSSLLLFNAVLNKYTKAATFVISRTDPKIYDLKGLNNSVVLMAAAQGDVGGNFLKVLCEKKIKFDSDCTDWENKTPLHRATSIMAVEQLVKIGFNPFADPYVALQKIGLSAIEFYYARHLANENKKAAAADEKAEQGNQTPPYLEMVKTALKYCPKKILYSSSSQARLLHIVNDFSSKKKPVTEIALIFPYILDLNKIPSNYKQSNEYKAEKLKREQNAAEEEKAVAAEKQRFTELIARYRNEIKEVLEQEEIVYCQYKAQQTIFTDLGCYIFSQLGEQSFDDFAPRWLTFVQLIMLLQKNIGGSSIKEVQKLIKAAKELTHKARPWTLDYHNILNKLLPEHPDQSDIEKLKTECATFLGCLKKISPRHYNFLPYNILEPWINGKIFLAAPQQQQAAIALPPAEQKHPSAAHQQAAAAPPAKQKLDTDVTHHRHPVPSMNPATAGKWNELVPLRQAAVANEQPRQQPAASPRLD